MPTFRIEEVALYYELAGTGASTVGLLNGIAMSTGSWQPIRERLAARGFRCLLHDFRGQLRSDKPTDKPYSLEQHAADLVALLDALNIERLHLVGTSYGAEVAMIFAYTYPERVQTLTLIAAASELDGLLRSAASSWAAAADCSSLAFFRCMAPWAYSSAYLTRSQPLLAEQEQATERLPRSYFSAFRELVQAFLDLDITSRLERIACPTLVMSAELDLIKGPAFGRMINERVAGSEFKVVPAAGHAVVLERPDLVAEWTMEFIDRRHHDADAH